MSEVIWGNSNKKTTEHTKPVTSVICLSNVIFLNTANTGHVDEKHNNDSLPSYLPVLCQYSTIRTKDSTSIIQLSTILFWNGSFRK